ncbi:MAG: DUF2924 domain-containing protein [Gemmataceae bacterium]
MIQTLAREVAALQRLTVKQLRQKYAEVFGEETNGHNKTWLVKRIAWRMQALAEGDLSDRARRRAAELARDADLRLNPPSIKAGQALEQQVQTRVLELHQDDRLPPPGTVITRKYKGQLVQVRVRPDGFEFEGERYRSLSAVARKVTGTHCNGFRFFNLEGGK